MSVEQDSWLYAALAPGRSLEPTDAEIAPVIVAVGTSRGRRRLSHGGRMLAIALPALLLVATAAAAATGLIPVGSVIRGVGFKGDDRPVVKETVVATGTLEAVGEWRITTFETREGAPCLKLELLDLDARRAPGPSSSGYCGSTAGFTEFSHGRRAAALERGAVLLFGTAPKRARSVTLAGPGRAKIVVRAHPAPGTRSSYWVASAPADLEEARLTWAGRDGRARATLDVSHRFAGPSAPTVVASGSTPVAGPWRMTVYESERSVLGGDLYEPEGLPCIMVRLLDPPPGTAGASGGCGVQPRTPGFTRGQTRIPAIAGTPPRELILYGHAPERADSVEVRAGGRTVSTPTVPAPPGIPGRFWLLARPPQDFANGRVYWVDEDSGARGRPVEVLPP